MLQQTGQSETQKFQFARLILASKVAEFLLAVGFYKFKSELSVQNCLNSLKVLNILKIFCLKVFTFS